MKVYFETYGCQMNVADTELMVGIILERGHQRAASPEQADAVLLNTCAVREKAEDRIFGRLGWLKPLKQARPALVIGVTGCMAEHLRDKLAERAPYVDLIAGPDAYRRLPDLLERAAGNDTRGALIDVRLDRQEVYEGADACRTPGVSGYVTIMRGCDKFCSFCIVPYVRGRERSVTAREVLRQCEAMAAGGFKEVVLLGQTVSSYHDQQAGCRFGGLLERVSAVAGLQRIRFTAPYPSDFTPELLETLERLPRVERHLHLPLQSGSSRVLAAMRRGYDADQYLELCRNVRRELPAFSITTDLIVGYPGETDADFEATLELSAEVMFDQAYMFTYSERSMTYAARHASDDVPPEVKKERLQRLIKLQQRSSRHRSRAMIGQRVEVLVKGPNPRPGAAPEHAGLPASGPQVIGRTSCFKTTVLAGEHAAGELVAARIGGASTHTLYGEAMPA